MYEKNSLKKSNRWTIALILSGLISLAIWSRVFPHPANMTALVPATLLAGYLLPTLWLAALVPILALAISDAFFFGFYPGIEYVYIAALMSVFIGRSVQNKKWGFAVAGGLVSSVLFFLICNLGVWMTTALYAKTWEGLVQCYVMALPFFRNQILGDIVYGAILLVSVRIVYSVARANEASTHT